MHKRYSLKRYNTNIETNDTTKNTMRPKEISHNNKNILTNK